MGVGYECVLTAGLQTVGKARDVTGPTGTATEVDVTVRDSGGWKEFEQGLKEYGITIDQLWVPTDAALQALESAYFSGSQIAWQAVDANGYGYSGNAIVVGIDFGQPLDDAVVMPVTLKGTGAMSPVEGS